MEIQTEIAIAQLPRKVSYHEEEGQEDDDTGGWIVEAPSFPSGEIDFDIDVVQMLVDAYPEALTNDMHYVGTPLRILCNGL